MSKFNQSLNLMIILNNLQKIFKKLKIYLLYKRRLFRQVNFIYRKKIRYKFRFYVKISRRKQNQHNRNRNRIRKRPFFHRKFKLRSFSQRVLGFLNELKRRYKDDFINQKTLFRSKRLINTLSRIKNLFLRDFRGRRNLKLSKIRLRKLRKITVLLNLIKKNRTKHRIIKRKIFKKYKKFCFLINKKKIRRCKAKLRIFYKQRKKLNQKLLKRLYSIGSRYWVLNKTRRRFRYTLLLASSK